MAVPILERAYDLGRGLDRVRRGAAIIAGMQIVARALNVDFAVNDAAQARR